MNSEPLTCLYSIIAVTGLAGHAYGSWAHSDQKMWLRDYLPKDVPNARVLTYGYPSQLQGNMSRSILSDYSDSFARQLLDMRASARVSWSADSGELLAEDPAVSRSAHYFHRS